MVYSLTNTCTKNIGIGQSLLKLSLVVGWYTFLKNNVEGNQIRPELKTINKYNIGRKVVGATSSNGFSSSVIYSAVSSLMR